MKKLLIAALGAVLWAAPTLADDNVVITQANGSNAALAASCTGGSNISGPPKVCSLTPGGLASHISTATTTVVKSGAGFLHSITINTKGTVASTVTVYDNTAGSGTVLAVIDSLTLSGTFALNVAFATGLTIVTTGTAAPDLTVSYR